MTTAIQTDFQLGEIKNSLGTPYFQDENVLIYHGDCLDLMSRMPSELFDLTVTSPPYNIGKEYEAILEIGQYLNWTEAWIAQIYRLTKEDGAFWLNVGYVSLPDKAKAIPLPYLLWDRVPFFLIQEVVWNYGAGVAARLSFSPRNEKLLWYVKNPEMYTFNLDDIRDPDVKYPNQKKNGKLKCNPLGKNPTDVWSIPKVTSGQNRMSPERTPHPAQFPVSLIERIILGSSHEHSVVFDPFLGSGTTAEVALRHGRTVVGCEIREDYCEIAAKRLLAYRKQRDLSITNAQHELFDFE